MISTCEFPIWYDIGTNVIVPDNDIDVACGVGLHTRRRRMLCSHKRLHTVLTRIACYLEMFQDVAQAV